MSRSSRRLAALVAVAAVLGAGCTDSDVDGADAASVLDDAGAPAAVQTCVGDNFDAEFTQGELNEIGGADVLSDLDDELEPQVQAILDECVESDGESPDPDADDSETTESTEADAGEGSDTTEAGGSTTTTAG